MGDILSWLKDKFHTIWEYGRFWFVVNEYQEAVLLTNGKYSGTFTAGLYFKFPFWEYVYEVNIKSDTLVIPPISCTTLDGKTISIGLVMDYHIDPMIKNQRRLSQTNSKKFILDNNDSISNLRDKSAGELSDLMEDTNWDEIRKKGTKTALKNKIIKYANNLGVTIDDLKFTFKSECSVYHLLGSDHKEGIPFLMNN